MDSHNAIYLDHAAATPVRPEVRDAMAPLMEGIAGNPSSVHRWGRAARTLLEEARGRTAAVLDVPAESIHFVRGGTESVNLAVLGRVEWARARGVGHPVLQRSAIEHSAVRESMAYAESLGCSVEEIGVRPDGSLRPSDVAEPYGEEVHLISVQWVNHETGLILPIEELSELCRSRGVALHVDAVQAAGKVPLNLVRLPIALLSLSGHKLGGPRGTGILVIQPGTEVFPRIFGGGQEHGIRPGTEDVAGAIGIACALELALAALDDEAKRLAELRSLLEERLVNALPGIRVHGKEGGRAPHILNIGVPGLPRDVLPGALDLVGVGASAGSACRSGATAVSPVLAALYGEAAERVAPLRLSLGWSTTREEVEEAARRISLVVQRAADA